MVSCFRGYSDWQGLYDSSKGDQDVLAAIAFVQSQGAKQVILLGASIGADAWKTAAFPMTCVMPGSGYASLPIAPPHGYTLK